jgi:hypothetical protein
MSVRLVAPTVVGKLDEVCGDENAWRSRMAETAPPMYGFADVDQLSCIGVAFIP